MDEVVRARHPARADRDVAPPARADPPPLIPRDVLFGNLEKASPAISPDGVRLAYLAPSNGVLAVWVRTIGRSDDRVVASDANRQSFLAKYLYGRDEPPKRDENVSAFLK